MRHKQYHFIGIGGIGMSALARILLDQKKMVSGSDLNESWVIEDLRKRGAVIHKGHSARYISPQDIVVYSTAVKESNPEYVAAVALKCRMMHRSELLASLMEKYETIAVAGSHGKTTTSSLMTTLFLEAKLHPSYALGGLLQEKNGESGTGDHFLFEADESDGSFLNYHPDFAIITNVEKEHMDHYGSEEALFEAFATFISQVKKRLFYCGDDPILASLAKGRGVSYGFSPKCDLQIKNFQQQGWQFSMDLIYKGNKYEAVKVALVGKHNALNAAAVFGLGLQLGLQESVIRKALQHFPGVKRRCERKSNRNQVLMLDDYAHHPTEIEAVLKGIKEAVQERRIVVLYQPHRFTRTQLCQQEHGIAFDWADKLYVTDIYSAGEDPIAGVDAQGIVSEIKKQSTIPCSYLPKEQWREVLQNELRPHDVFVTLGAGDVTKCHDFFGPDFSPRKWRVGLVYGGLSSEHEISLRSARFVHTALDRSLYEIEVFGIDQEGNWVTGARAEEILYNEKSVPFADTESLLSPGIATAIERCEIFLPILHGPNGEDGSIQGLFEMLGKAYAGSGYASCAMVMNKEISKKFAQQAGVPTPPYLSMKSIEWRRDREKWIDRICTTLKMPVYVKPMRLGSSVGVGYVREKGQLAIAIDKALRYDSHILVEEGIISARELEFAVMGNENGFSIQVPRPGEKLAKGEFVDYEKKYGKVAIPTTIEPTLSKEVLAKGRELAERTYRALGCSGLTRVDFLLDPQGNWWFFELNSIPGLQPLSLFPKIWKREGMEPSQFVDRLVILALQKQYEEKRHFHPLYVG
ncbi:MAG: UDP-N-acetylmuramate--L-alanine ligase [Chlamydiales bacterium]